MTRPGILIVLLAAAGLLHAQQPTELPAPKEPILPRAPERAEWTILLHFDREAAKKNFLNPGEDKQGVSEAAKQAPSYPREIRISKDGSTYREVMVWPNGTTTEKWVVDNLQVQRNPQGDIVRIMPPSGYYSKEYSDYARSDFEVLEWIGRGNYKGVRLAAGQPVYAFEVTGDKRKLTPREEADVRRELRDRGDIASPDRIFSVYLNGKNQLPVYSDDGEIIRTYTFVQAPTEKLTPPPPIAQAINQWKKEIKRKNSVPLPP